MCTHRLYIYFFMCMHVRMHVRMYARTLRMYVCMNE